MDRISPNSKSEKRNSRINQKKSSIPYQISYQTKYNTIQKHTANTTKKPRIFAAAIRTGPLSLFFQYVFHLFPVKRQLLLVCSHIIPHRGRIIRPAEQFGKLLHYDADEGDPVRDGILPTILEKLNKHGVEYEYLNQEELRKNPVLLEKFAGALYYNDLKGITLPEDFPAAQIFGWDPMGAALDRITTNDFEVVNIAFDFFRRAGVRRAAIVWREDMVLIPDHPRIAGFLSRMDAAGIAASPLSFRREDPDFTARMKEYIESGDDRIGFFGFNALCGVKLCCALDALGLLAKYSERSILICDKSILLSGFYPRPAMIDLNLPAMADRAVEMLLYRLANPETPGLLALQSPRLLTT